jgi:hypothetical protein
MTARTRKKKVCRLKGIRLEPNNATWSRSADTVNCPQTTLTQKRENPTIGETAFPTETNVTPIIPGNVCHHFHEKRIFLNSFRKGFFVSYDSYKHIIVKRICPEKKLQKVAHIVVFPKCCPRRELTKT